MSRINVPTSFVKTLRQRFIDSVDTCNPESKIGFMTIVEQFTMYMCGEFNVSPKSFTYIMGDVSERTDGESALLFALEYVKGMVAFTSLGDSITTLSIRDTYKTTGEFRLEDKLLTKLAKKLGKSTNVKELNTLVRTYSKSLYKNWRIAMFKNEMGTLIPYMSELLSFKYTTLEQCEELIKLIAENMGLYQTVGETPSVFMLDNNLYEHSINLYNCIMYLMSDSQFLLGLNLGYKELNEILDATLKYDPELRDKYESMLICKLIPNGNITLRILDGLNCGGEQLEESEYYTTKVYNNYPRYNQMTNLLRSVGTSDSVLADKLYANCGVDLDIISGASSLQHLALVAYEYHRKGRTLPEILYDIYFGHILCETNFGEDWSSDDIIKFLEMNSFPISTCTRIENTVEVVYTVSLGERKVVKLENC